MPVLENPIPPEPGRPSVVSRSSEKAPDGPSPSRHGGRLAAPAQVPRSRLLPPGARVLLSAACVVVLVAGLRAAAELLRPFVLALFLAIISIPLLSWLRRRGVPRVLAVFATVMAVILVVSGVAAMMGGSLNSLTEQLPKYQDRMGEMLAAMQAQVDRLGLGTEQLKLTDVVDAGAVVEVARTAVTSVANLLSKGLLVLLALIFVLLEATGLQDKLRLAFGADLDTQGLSRAMREIQSYLAIKTAVSLTTGLLIWAWVALLGIDFAVLWGLVAFVFNYIPNLGSIFAAIPTVLLALVQKGAGVALLVALGYLLVNFILGNLLEPNLMGRRLGLSTLVVFMSLVFWGWVWGPLGMLLSVPLTMVLKILMENLADFRWVAVLLGPNPTSHNPNPL